MIFSSSDIGNAAEFSHLRPPAGEHVSRWWRRVTNWIEANLSRLARPLTALPPIVVGGMEHHELNVLAMASPHHDALVSDALFYELDRAEVVPDNEVERGIIRMGSNIVYRTSAGSVHRVSLVYPEEADANAGKISVLSRVGAALIGLGKGQSIPLRDEDGRHTILTVVSAQEPPGRNGFARNTVAGVHRRP